MPFWKTIQDHLIGSITAGGLVLVAAGAYWVDLHKEKILDWVAGVQIEVSSTNRPSVSSFIAGEEIRFSLKGVESDKVFWVFDEDEKNVVETRGPEIRYTFQFDPKGRKNVEWDRRVDAFFKKDGVYRPAWKLVRVINTSLSTGVHLGSSGLRLTVAQPLQGDWKLTGARLATFENAAVQDKLDLAQAPGGRAGEEWTFTSLTSAFTKALGGAKNTWLSLDFISPAGNQTLRLMKPLPALDNRVAGIEHANE
jgi:hypothetical protein